jgi:hypothetical protein
MHTEENLTEDQKTGLAIEKELEALFEEGVTELTSMELEHKCPITFKVMNETHEVEEHAENGIETTNFSILESSETPETFKISRND